MRKHKKNITAWPSNLHAPQPRQVSNGRPLCARGRVWRITPKKWSIAGDAATGGVWWRSAIALRQRAPATLLPDRQRQVHGLDRRITVTQQNGPSKMAPT
ncbi:MAG: hypothetical protein H7836_12105 [Magnetococcus sp. YQC-3]